MLRLTLTPLYTRPNRPIRCAVWIIERMRYRPTIQPTNRPTNGLDQLYASALAHLKSKNRLKSFTFPRYHRCKIGNLPPNSTAVLSFSYVVDLASTSSSSGEGDEDGAVIFTLPSVLNPRYCPAGLDKCTGCAPVTANDGEYRCR